MSSPPPSKKKGQNQNYGASINSNGLLTLSGLLSLHFLLNITTSFIKPLIITCKLYMKWKITTKLRQSTFWWRLKLIMAHNRLFQKIFTPPLWTTLNWVPTNFRVFKRRTTAVFAGFQILLNQILRNSRISQKS